MDKKTSSENVRQAGRGGLAVAFAKIYFILVGFVQQIVFKRVLGLDGYGALSTALSTASILYNPITQASIQGVSREVAGAEEDERPRVFRRVLSLHCVFAVVAGIVFYFWAEPTARLLGAPHVGKTLRVLSAILFLYGIYTPLVGALNGLRRFGSQALLDVIAATARTLGLLGGALLGARGVLGETWNGPEGAALGFVAAGFVILAIALLVTGTGARGGQRPSVRGYFVFVVPLLSGQTLLNVLFQADALLLRRFAAEAASSAGLAPEAADPFVGAYRAAQLFGFLPYQILMSVTFVLFPLLAAARAANDPEKVRDYVRGGVRLAALLAGLMSSVLLAVPSGLIALVYGADAAELAGGALRILAFGLGFFAVLGVMTSALNSLGGERASLWVIGSAVVLVTGLCFLARGDELSAELLVRIASATSVGLIVATLLAAQALASRAGGVIAPSSLLRVALALGVSAGVGAAIAPQGVIATLATALLVVALYFATLVASRELGGADLERLRTVLGRAAK